MFWKIGIFMQHVSAWVYFENDFINAFYKSHLKFMEASLSKSVIRRVFKALRSFRYSRIIRAIWKKRANQKAAAVKYLRAWSSARAEIEMCNEVRAYVGAFTQWSEMCFVLKSREWIKPDVKKSLIYLLLDVKIAPADDRRCNDLHIPYGFPRMSKIATRQSENIWDPPVSYNCDKNMKVE